MPAFRVTYRTQWEDGFGARGWKLDSIAQARDVIACTSYTGPKTPTSVLIHDMLDHLVSGFGLGGYVEEAKATTLHGLRNGIEIRSSFELMIDEILAAPVVAESLLPFLPLNAATPLLPDYRLSHGKRNELLAGIGYDALRETLLAGFFAVGAEGVPKAIQNWRSHGLDFRKMRAIGLALQNLLSRADAYVAQHRIQSVQAEFRLFNETCSLRLDRSSRAAAETMTESVL